MSLELHNATYRYRSGGRDAVSGVTLSVRPGERVCLFGANASGKSTIARMMCADLVPTTGCLTVDGELTTEPGCKGLVAFVGQDASSQMTSLRVDEEVSFGPRCQMLDDALVTSRVDEALRICGIESLRERSVYELSGGQQQLLCLAGALALSPRYLILDESSAHLDAESRARMLDIVSSRCREGVGVLHITHDMAEVEGCARVCHVQSGRIVWEGSPEQWRGRCEAGLGLQARECATAGDLSFAAPDKLRSLRLVDAVASYGSNRVIDGMNLEVSPGELVLLCGPSGSGKSTIAHVLAGVHALDRGRALLGETDVKPSNVGLSFQRAESQLFEPTIWDDVAFGPRNLNLPEETVALRTEQALRATGVDESLWQRHSQTLSGGMRRRAALASTLALAPGAYVLDEPSAGLDAEGAAFLHGVVQRLCELGCPVLLVTHNPQEWAHEAARTVSIRPIEAERSDEARKKAAAKPLLTRIDARVRMLALLVLTLLLFACDTLTGIGVAFVLTLLLCFGAGVHIPTLAKRLLPAVPILTLVLLANGIRIDGTASTALWGPIGVDSLGFQTGAIASTRVVTLVLLVASLTAGLSTTDVSRVTSLLLAPMARLGVPVADASMVLSVTMCLIPQTYREFWNIERAQRARAAHFDDGPIVRRIAAWAAVMVPLVVTLFDRSEALARAMRLRGYRGRMTMPSARLSALDWVTIALLAALSALLVIR
ncbi:MAG: ATP-binding cassette domain-containing protein [Atopobiaceae bacterium]|nr:ATP-binding cassette domain-containing protein [Atopobiaceae bacterium]